MQEVFEGHPITFTQAMSESSCKEQMELFTAVYSMAKGKAPGHDGILLSFFNSFGWYLVINFIA